jgi:hypothetical protein
MPFEVMLRGTHEGPPVERRDPFTGKPAIVVPLEMNDAELAAVLAVIRRYEGTPQDGIRLADASLSWVDFDREGALVGLRGDPASWARVLFDLANAGNLAILSVATAAPAATSATTLARIHACGELNEASDEPAVVVADAPALANHLAADIREAAAFTARALDERD